ncbi:fatty acyl-CoA reductase wat-like [Sitodiplosis mosellana]|uniref:fatty acyl-CoA reductase wat-like n=1 Tax=Sitodiplosis mosellana TaxID=263140 RepID=UPI0024440DA4|nr:fatty acyl-CoA reductase wat-like [Sitodiplosis mosellana]XP_055317181.1 fatty acyl-CoA reductase wat-like [Sitodiplosis mosellana]XP_055317182.1 fatty acyl-CoA reductase wat-like [Sitodiplosis mosellana]XP_055317183.1 fatty acyl-CoA reductase wat-like [Sitodiplosis mosellana]
MDLATESVVVVPPLAKVNNNSSTDSVTTATLVNNNNQLIMDEELFTPIQKFYDNCNIFITGGTGFLGKMLINKLLTSCSSIDTIYLLVRNKKGKDVHSRIEDIFDDPIFDIMKRKVPKFRRKVQGVPGDCMLPGLGLTSADKQLLVKNVNIVFHMAATVRFDEKLKIAMQINVQACKDVMQICSEMVNLKSIVHVSTAYTQCPQRYIEEKFYPPPLDSGEMLVLTKCTSDKLLECITPVLLDKWPNTYTFTKAIAEDVVHQHGAGLPIGMFRPGIVISTYRDPVSGWIDNFYGPTGAIAGAGTGVIRTLRANPNAAANMVPVDLCVNGIIATAWNVGERYAEKICPMTDIPVFNFCTAPTNQLTWGDFTIKTTKYGLMYPTLKSIWYLCYANNPNKFMHMASILFLHYLPALLIDAFAICIGKKPRLLNTYKKIHRFMNVIEFFAMRQWDYQQDNLIEMWTSLSEKDKDIFFFDMRQLDWDLFLQHYFRGIRQYLLNDPLETIPEALVRWNRLYWIHQCVKVVVFLILLRIAWWLMSLFI